MNIGAAATASGLPVKTIRYYEDIGLIRPLRGENGYRDFSDNDLHKLVFLGRARRLGFSIEDCRTLLSLYEDRDRASADVKAIARDHMEKVAAKIEELKSLHHVLENLIRECQGDNRPDCPILADLAGATSDR